MDAISQFRSPSKKNKNGTSFRVGVNVSNVSSKQNYHHQRGPSVDYDSSSSSASGPKADLLPAVLEQLKQEAKIPADKIESEVNHFFLDLGLPDAFFDQIEVKTLKNHITSFYCAKVIASITSNLELAIEDEIKGRAVYALPSVPGATVSPSTLLEYELEERFLLESYRGSRGTAIAQDRRANKLQTAGATSPLPLRALKAAASPARPISPTDEAADECGWRLQSFRTRGVISAEIPAPLRLYVLEEPHFADDALLNLPADGHMVDEATLNAVLDVKFRKQITKNSRASFAKLLAIASDPKHLGPAIHCQYYVDSGEYRLLMAYRRNTSHSLLSGLTTLYHSLNLHSTKKFVEQLANGFVIHSIYVEENAQQAGDEDDDEEQQPVTHGRLLERFDGTQDVELVRGTISDKLELRRVKAICEALHRGASFIYSLPRTSLSSMVTSNEIGTEEHAYAYCAWKFAFHFLSRFSQEYEEIDAALTAENSARAVFSSLKSKMALEAVTETRVKDIIMAHPQLISLLFADFESRLSPSNASAVERASSASLSEPSNVDILTKIQRQVHGDELETLVWNLIATFNRAILRTNFFFRSKVALGFRLSPAEFLNSHAFPVKPYAITMIVGSSFRGFHIRFADVARGGVRVIQSRSQQAFSANLNSLFEENYNLAFTQQMKNKDLAEGGSKGTILLAVDHQTRAKNAFQQYIDVLLDLTLPAASDEMVDLLKKEEIVFLGPDEGTADLMDWAAEHARRRGSPAWKAFTTGKSQSLGGIPHDLYGMTTLSVHTNVLAMLQKVGIDETHVRKLQTGGPDGDLGSNELLISKDKTIAIVDGGGVLFDPEGLNREELHRLARRRLLGRHFSRKLLSTQAFYVDVDDVDVRLPSGVLVESGLRFRNSFHLNSMVESADLFVPCGGRPKAVHLGNVQELFDGGDQPRPRFKYIVEGANLFFTQEARLELEKRGVILIKDSTANKGGVTSSSLEVLAALALPDDEFAQHMCAAKDSLPPFYQAYVKDVQATIAANAKAEFECIWRENARTGLPRSVLSDRISSEIVKLQTKIELKGTALWENEQLRKSVLVTAIPPTLVNHCQEKLFSQVPESYLKALFASHLSASFVYEVGLAAPEFAFFEFCQQYLKKKEESTKSGSEVLEKNQPVEVTEKPKSQQKKKKKGK